MTEPTSLGKALVDAIRAIPAWVADKLDEHVRGLHAPLKAAPGVLICRLCQKHGVPLSWPCAVRVEQEKRRDPHLYRQFVLYVHSPVSGDPPRRGAWCDACDQPWPCAEWSAVTAAGRSS
jgi:hypothetical protein